MSSSESDKPASGVDAVREALIEKLRSTPRLIHNPEGQSYGEGWISNDYAMRDVMLQAADYLASLPPSTSAAEPVAAVEDLSEIESMLDAGQGDDDGPQILPDFEPGWSVVAKVEACLHLLEVRRDALAAYEATPPAPAAVKR